MRVGDAREWGAVAVLYFLWLDVPPAEAPASAGMTGGPLHRPGPSPVTPS